ncbi:efflux RND transporter permease subunit [Mangrovicoccus sp. HB161399]|uniref:efflux RND transporter permease subunit n=1 Tax=Mangrovicoccus sp. HB161399 TaxID=2720392 RepID=UPI0015542663|nr:efflux RND transporter permease subunit [Mangrovicoccus sp. HB161399]
MTGLVDWAAGRARMIVAFIVLSLAAGAYCYATLPKEGEPDIEIPMLFVSVPFPGISATDSEKLLVRPMETELSDLDGLKSMKATAAENYAGIALEFEFGWDKTKIMADVRDAMNSASADFPDGAEQYSINEINFSEFPIVIVSLTGEVPERTLVRLAKSLQDRLESQDAVLEAVLAGSRDEMVEVVIDPIRLEAYNVTAAELINVVQNNNKLIAAGEIQSPTGAFSLKIPSSFDESRDLFNLPVKTNGDRVVTLSDLADIRLTFEDRAGTARFDGQKTVALQVVKRKGFNLIETAAMVRDIVAEERATWPPELQDAVSVETSNDQSYTVASMISQLEGSVLTAIALVMIVVLASLGGRPALLVGFAIPTSFLLCFVFLAVMGVTISNIVMFGLILAVGMLVDGAIVVVEYAESRIDDGQGPMRAYVEGAKRMFWPIVSSTATTLCAFLPMLFWPGVAGEFMGMLPVTLIFVLSASLIVALVYLPVMGGVAGRINRSFHHTSETLRGLAWPLRAGLLALAIVLTWAGFRGLLTPSGAMPALPALAFVAGLSATAIAAGSLRRPPREDRLQAGYRRTLFGRFIAAIAGNPVMPLVTIAAVIAFVAAVFMTYGQKNYGAEFFVETEPEQAIVYVRARGNLSVDEKDALVRRVEKEVLATEGVASAFSFAGDGGLNSDRGGGEGPRDAIGQVQFETLQWDDRPTLPFDGPWWQRLLLREVPDPFYDGNAVLARIEDRLAGIPGIFAEVSELAQGPGEGKPVHLRLIGTDFDAIAEAAQSARAQMEGMAGFTAIEDTLPLPGIDWEIDVDVEAAGRYGADVATVGGMVQLVTRGILQGTMRVDSSDEEIEIRTRLPEEYRLLSTLETLKLRTSEGLVPLTNFISIRPVPKLAQIDRIDQKRYYDVKADILPGLENDAGQPITANERIAKLTEWLGSNPLPAGVTWEWTGDQEEQQETADFLGKAFLAALFLMFIILLAQFNSLYNSVLVLLAVVLSTAGVLIGMLVMQQPFSFIMTGTGVVALAGIVVNNNIVLIDTYQEFSRYMPRIEAIIRTAEARIRPVLLTTLTTMAGLMPMMFGLSLDFINGGATIDSPTALWWKQLATAVVFGLGIATALTLVFTPAMLAARVWANTYALAFLRWIARWSGGRGSRAAEDWLLRRRARRAPAPEILWDTDLPASDPARLRAAE